MMQQLPPAKPKRQWGMFIAGMMWGGALMFIAIVLWLRANVIIDEPCTMPFDTAHEQLKLSAESMPGWRLNHVPCGVNLTADSTRVELLQLCNGKYLTMALADPEMRSAGAFLPCRVILYEKDGGVRMARLNLHFLAAILGKRAQPLISNQIALEQEEIVARVRRDAR